VNKKGNLPKIKSRKMKKGVAMRA